MNSLEPVEQAVWAALQDVYDPEIPTLSVIDLGMVDHVTHTAGDVTVALTPTFLGCPALSFIRRDVEHRVSQVEGVERVHVAFVHDPPWTTDRLTDKGRQRLRDFGIAPPTCGLLDGHPLQADCPYCGSERTRVENLFGPTACRSLFFCNDCRQPFEAMKPV